MKRDELLTKLAMDEPPELWKGHQERKYAGHWYGWNEYQLRRAELINKPPWDDAPDDAEWLAQDEDGKWVWHPSEPEVIHEEWYSEPLSYEHNNASHGAIPAGHDWRDTLEPRPVPQDLHDAQDKLGNAWACDRRAVIDEMARIVSPDEWRGGGHMRYAGHTITWGEYVTRRHEIEDEEPWLEDRADAIGQNGPTGDYYDYTKAPCGADSSACFFNPCDECPDEYAEDSDAESALSQALREKRPGVLSTPEEVERWFQRNFSEAGGAHFNELGETAHDCPRCGGEWWSPPHSYCPCEDAPRQSKYHREIKPGVFVDVYDVLAAWDVANPALQHLIKKALQPGERGHKTIEQDMDDIVASAKRARELVK